MRPDFGLLLTLSQRRRRWAPALRAAPVERIARDWPEQRVRRLPTCCCEHSGSAGTSQRFTSVAKFLPLPPHTRRSRPTASGHRVELLQRHAAGKVAFAIATIPMAAGTFALSSEAPCCSALLPRNRTPLSSHSLSSSSQVPPPALSAVNLLLGTRPPLGSR